MKGGGGRAILDNVTKSAVFFIEVVPNFNYLCSNTNIVFLIGLTLFSADDISVIPFCDVVICKAFLSDVSEVGSSYKKK